MVENEKNINKVFAKKAPSYLYLIGNTYYFRYRLPKKYQKVLGRTEIRVHLASSYISQARKRAYVCYAQVQNYLEGLQMPRAKNKNIPRICLSDESNPSSSQILLSHELDSALNSLDFCNMPSKDSLFGGQKKIETFFARLDEDPNFTLQSKEELFADNKIQLFKSLPDYFAFDAENKEEISLDTIEGRMQGLLRFLLDEDRANLKPRQSSHNTQEIFVGQMIVDADESITHKEYLRRYESFYRHFINNQEAIIGKMEIFERFLFMHPAVLECEITRDNVLIVINEYCKVMLTYYQILQARADFDYSKEKTVCSSNFITYPPVPASSFESAREPSPIMPTALLKATQSKEESSEQKKDGIKTSEFITLYAKYKVSDGKWRDLTASTVHLQRLQFLVDILGDMPINTINHSHRREFFETLKLLPKSHRAPKYRGLSLKKLLAMKDKELLSPKSINVILQAVSSMFTWGIAEGLLEVNPFKALSVPDNRNEKDLRLAFSATDLQKIFSSATIQEAKSSDRPSRFWVPYIGLYTGMRLNEVAQLYIEDIKVYAEDGVDYYYIDVTAQNGDDKSLKAKYSERVVPIHARLIELGFLDFVQKQKKAKHVRLFPEITVTASKGRYGHAISRFFSDLVKREKIEGKKTFHSLRHTFVEFFEKNDLMTNAFKQVLGHTSEDLASKQYGSKFTVKECYDRVIRHLKLDV